MKFQIAIRGATGTVGSPIARRSAIVLTMLKSSPYVRDRRTQSSIASYMGA